MCPVMGCPRPSIIADHDLIMLVVNGDNDDTNDFLQVQENNADASAVWMACIVALYKLCHMSLG